ncbi:MAG: RNA-binding transcriptional accessory protein [Deltaproteobacteria bacterium]|jgi:uncharacterized protein|nr:RNA-binding transcriptional accessory protein [Deltaproteobacteria bacterium]
MNDHHIKIAQTLSLTAYQTASVLKLFDEGASVPFIARYRKEVTGSLDEVQILAIRDLAKSLSDLEDRLTAVIKSLEERQLLNPQLQSLLMAAETLTELEDIYLPYRPKKRTRAMAAREKNLEPLALALKKQDPQDDPQRLALEAIENGAQAENADEALSGARDIIAEIISEDLDARKQLREYFEQNSFLVAKLQPGKEEIAAKYKDYIDYSDKIASIPSHRFLAVKRAESEGIFHLQIQPDAQRAIEMLKGLFVLNQSPCALETTKALEDSYKRLLAPTLETELRLSTKKRADMEAITVFSTNLRELLLAPPLGEKPILAIDPGLKSGCKIVALAANGTVLEYATIYPHFSGQAERKAAEAKIIDMIMRHQLTHVALGNGTGGRETHDFLINIPNFPKDVPIIFIDESGASIYSASDLARQEFPDLDLTIRGAISIGRRLNDPLSELVKIAPKSIGVGQYQHDVDQNLLGEKLDDVVVSCVNQVGVEANLASEKLLSYISGIGPSLAKNFVKHRNEKGAFKNRKEFLKVARLGPKLFEQCAGFLRIKSSENPLDNSAVHPESYHVVEKMAGDLGVNVSELIGDKRLIGKIKLADYVTDEIGLPTLQDIVSELQKPGRDPREPFKVFSYTDGIMTLKDVKTGMNLKGRINNITDFGAFVDVGIHVGGLLHISKLSRKFIKHPSEIVKIGQEVEVTVIGVDLQRERLQLSLIDDFERHGDGDCARDPAHISQNDVSQRQVSSTPSSTQSSKPISGPKQHQKDKASHRNRQPVDNPFSALKNWMKTGK